MGGLERCSPTLEAAIGAMTPGAQAFLRRVSFAGAECRLEPGHHLRGDLLWALDHMAAVSPALPISSTELSAEPIAAGLR